MINIPVIRFVLFLAFIASTFGDISVISSAGKTTQYGAVNIGFGKKNWVSLSAEFFLPDSEVGCQPIPEANGKILIVSENYCSPQTIITSAVASQAVGLIIYRLQPVTLGILSFEFDYGKKSSFDIPVLEVFGAPGVSPFNIDVVQKLKTDKAAIANITLLENKDNEWELFVNTGAWTYVGVLLLILAFVTLLFSIRKIFLFKKADGRLKLTIPQVVFFISAFQSLLRIVYLVDPYFTRKIYPYQVSRSLEHQTLGFSVLSSTLIALFWFEQSHNIKRGTPPSFGSRKYRIMAGIICTVYLIIDVAVIFERALYIKFLAGDILIGGVYYLSHILCVIFFFVAGFGLLKRISRLTSKLTVLQLIRSRVGALVLLSGFLNVFLIFILGLFYSPLYGPAAGSSLIYFLAFLTAYGITLPEVLVLTPKKDSSNQGSMQSSGLNKI